MRGTPHAWLLIAACVAAACGPAARPLAAPSSDPVPYSSGGRPTLAPMLERVVPGVVNISTTSRVRVELNPLFNDPFFRQFFDVPDIPREVERQSLGSGVVVDADAGLILTSYHVIVNADQIEVTLLDGRHFAAKVVGSDSDADISVIRISARSLTAVPLGDSDSLRVGDFVVAIGSPFGLGQTVTSGIVSALGRGQQKFIQTDASINPGNSGGALVDWDGRLIGINTAILGPNGGNVGIGFAAPVNAARRAMEQVAGRGGLGTMLGAPGGAVVDSPTVRPYCASRGNVFWGKRWPTPRSRLGWSRPSETFRVATESTPANRREHGDASIEERPGNPGCDGPRVTGIRRRAVSRDDVGCRTGGADADRRPGGRGWHRHVDSRRDDQHAQLRRIGP
jgi:S1-C subfamily serine protease